MWVYGDRTQTVARAACLAEIRAGVADLDSRAPGIVRHAALATLLLQAGALAQALEDDTRWPAASAAAFHLTSRLAASVIASWRSGFKSSDITDVRTALTELLRQDGPDVLQSRTPEGFAFYAVYPEAYAAAAAALLAPDNAFQVVGIRSIGTVLAAVVAEAVHSRSVCTVRPVGYPFARTVDASVDLLSGAQSHAIVVDEGPGASGSSFAAVADWLEAAGFAPDHIVFMPSHAGSPGAMASPPIQARWQRTRRIVASFDARHLPVWFADLVGSPVSPLIDLSGGAWRVRRAIDAPRAPAFERAKYLLHTASGMWLLKFVGLGRHGMEKFELAKRLHAAGFIPEPVALRHGFLIEPWHQEAAVGVPSIEHLGRYLGFRARCCPAGDADGASVATLCDMARHNTRERLGFEPRIDPRPPDAPLVRIDGRLHAWEWLSLRDGRLLKADSLDHHAAHDLVGCQPIAWDIAGAVVEFELSGDDAGRLASMVEHESGFATNPALIAAYVVFYSAFQLGLWQHTERQDFYARRLSGTSGVRVT